MVEKPVKFWEGTDRSVVCWFCRAPFLVDLCDLNFFPLLSPRLFFNRSHLSKDIRKKIRKCVSNTFPRCVDVSGLVSHMRGENFLLSSLDNLDRFCSLELFKNVLTFSSLLDHLLSLIPFSVSHLGLFFSVPLFFSMST